MKEQTILVTGAKGQLGFELSRISNTTKNMKFIFTDIEDIDISKKNEVENMISKLKPFAVINCAAYTAVDKAESDEKTAFLINEIGVKNLANSCKNNNSILIHISTDYVFDGKTHLPYEEADAVSPLGVYAKSKAAGELAIILSNANYIIIRTSWLYSVHGSNFVKTMLKLGQEREEINVVTDQVGSPTNAQCLAKAIISILPQIKGNTNHKEILHFTNTGVASWYDFAVNIFELSNIKCKVNPIPTKDYPAPAPRPYYSVLNTHKIKENYNIEIIHWREALRNCIEEMKLKK